MKKTICYPIDWGLHITRFDAKISTLNPKPTRIEIILEELGKLQRVRTTLEKGNIREEGTYYINPKELIIVKKHSTVKLSLYEHNALKLYSAHLEQPITKLIRLAIYKYCEEN